MQIRRAPPRLGENAELLPEEEILCDQRPGPALTEEPGHARQKVDEEAQNARRPL